MSADLAAAVIHHRHYPEVLRTLTSLVSAGIDPASLLVVDNSEDDATAEALRRSSRGWRVEVVENRGYGAAANVALRVCAEAEVLLLVTHETLIDAPSVAALRAALSSDPRVAAAGPSTLVTDRQRVWSRGGVLTRRLRMPKHLLDDDPAGGRAAQEVDWLDGACVMYRVKALTENPFREDFFLYFEETELHTRLRRAGWKVVTVAGATAFQSSDGMPAFWGSRNFVLFQAAHGSRTSRVVAPAYFTIRLMALEVLGGRWRQALDAPRGLVAGYRALREVSP